MEKRHVVWNLAIAAGLLGAGIGCKAERGIERGENGQAAATATEGTKKVEEKQQSIAEQIKELFEKQDRLIEELIAERRRLLGEPFRGIGVALALREEKKQLVIETVYAGSPAEKAGLRNGDAILAVDGVSMEGKLLKDAIREIIGPEEQHKKEATLTILRPGDNASRTITVPIDMIRFQLIVESVKDMEKNTEGGEKK